jgi:hypothetical protein
MSMGMNRRMAVCVLLAGSLAAACGDATGLDPADVNGTWTGSPIGIGQTLTLTLVDNRGQVTANGTMTNTPTGTRAMQGTGTFDGHRLVLTLSSGTAQPVNLSTRYHPSRPPQLIGELNGSGFARDSIILTKQ